MIRHDLPGINHITATDTHPPFYFWIMHVWRGLAGEGEFVLRFPSVLFGTLTIAATYVLGRAVGGPRTGLLAALFLAISRFAVTWSQEMRMYILAALLATLALWAAVRYWKSGSRYAWLGYVLTMAAGLLTLYLYVSVLLVANLAWLVVWRRSPDRRRRFVGWAAAQLAVLVLAAPWLNYALPRIPTWSVAQATAPDFFVRLYATLVTTGVPLAIERYSLQVTGVMLVLLAGLVALWLDRRQADSPDIGVEAGATALILGVLLPIATIYVVALPIRFFYTPRLAPRYLLVLSSCFYVLLAWGIVALARRQRWFGWLSASIVAVAALVGLTSFYPGRTRVDDYISLSKTLEAHVHPGDAVVLQDDTDWPIFAAHYGGYWHGVPSRRPNDPASVEAFLDPIWTESEGIWLVKTLYARQSDPDGRMQLWLSDRAQAESARRYASTELQFYARTAERATTKDELAAGATPEHRLEIELSPGLLLVSADAALSVYRVGDTLHLFLYWDGHVDNASRPIELILVDSKQRSARTIALTPQDGPGLRRQQVDVPLTTDLKPGRYTIRLDEHDIVSFELVGTTKADDDQQVNAPNPLQRYFSTGGDEPTIGLLGYDLAGDQLRAGETIELGLYWRTTTPVAERYKVFTHLVGDQVNPASGSILWGQHDAEPDNFMQPTTTWIPGEIIVDQHSIPIDPDAPPGRYRILVGLYDGLSGVRLDVYDEDGTPLGDHVTIGEVTIP
jgi:4-amino-4-deoxy-L-arabinose transferase-like glycosyltransferase